MSLPNHTRVFKNGPTAEEGAAATKETLRFFFVKPFKWLAAKMSVPTYNCECCKCPK
ncbi:hypothetical protein PBCV1_A685bR [Paramecium bursaria Chlorella virus 1]|uniref:Uncharacterized protein n=1 Tax=Paramecium bursaria Chlorella virus 1 TaxID=10506 RepID=F8TU87_PBCV1|nr:hypothetical protein PBCV1_A685bR [Paramecium bursaria Chlorella virus 1]AEI70148.1 hypothetical protein [Paramecium bursaria Chlorella virus 1]